VDGGIIYEDVDADDEEEEAVLYEGNKKKLLKELGIRDLKYVYAIDEKTFRF